MSDEQSRCKSLQSKAENSEPTIKSRKARWVSAVSPTSLSDLYLVSFFILCQLTPVVLLLLSSAVGLPEGSVS